MIGDLVMYVVALFMSIAGVYQVWEGFAYLLSEERVRRAINRPNLVERFAGPSWWAKQSMKQGVSEKKIVNQIRWAHSPIRMVVGAVFIWLGSCFFIPGSGLCSFF